MLYLMRHGQTDWNIAHRLQGCQDIPLNDTGRAMAKAAKSACDVIHLDICFVSPLCRARETAETVLHGRDIPIIIDDRLREIGFGNFEGTENASEDRNHPLWTLFHEPARYTAPPGAESLEALYARTGEFLHDTVYPYLAQGKDILIVGHGAMNLSIINQVRDIPLERFWEGLMNNCQLLLLPIPQNLL